VAGRKVVTAVFFQTYLSLLAIALRSVFRRRRRTFRSGSSVESCATGSD
jgi:hypothetical protein